MEDPEMMEMLNIYIMSAQIMGGMHGSHSDEGSKDHSIDQLLSFAIVLTTTASHKSKIVVGHGIFY